MHGWPCSSQLAAPPPSQLPFALLTPLHITTGSGHCTRLSVMLRAVSLCSVVVQRLLRRGSSAAEGHRLLRGGLLLLRGGLRLPRVGGWWSLCAAGWSSAVGGHSSATHRLLAVIGCCQLLRVGHRRLRGVVIACCGVVSGCCGCCQRLLRGMVFACYGVVIGCCGVVSLLLLRCGDRLLRVLVGCCGVVISSAAAGWSSHRLLRVICAACGVVIGRGGWSARPTHVCRS